MYYEDRSRRFNLLSGLVSGAVLGAGVALLLRPDLSAGTHRVRRAARGVGRSASRRLDDLREDARDAVQDSVRAGRKRFRP